MSRPSRPRRSFSSLNFQRLEDRQLLAADLVGGLQVPNDLPPETNLVSNGDFETFEQGTAPSFTNTFATGRFLPGANVTGWDVADGDGDTNAAINLLSFNNDRGTVLDLDSSTGQDDRVFQDITTIAGQQYLLSFDFLGPSLIGDADASTNDFEVYWNETLIAAMRGGQLWQTASFDVVGESTAAADDVPGTEVTSRLEFRDMRDGNRGGDGRGSLIDCVRLTAVTETSITNGGFEDVGSEVGPNFEPDNVEGWNVFNFSADTQPRVIQVNEFLAEEASVGGTNYLSLNSDATVIDQVFQDVNTVAGATYYVTFDYRTDPNSTADPDELRVRWNDAWAATFVGSSEWQSVGILLDADSDSARLNFREAGNDTGDGAGVHIDNVQVFQIDQVVNDFVVDLNGGSNGNTNTVTFTENGVPAAISPDLTISHESGTQISSAAVALLGDVALATEALALDSSAVIAAGLSSEYNVANGLLTLTGDASIETYQNVLRTLTYADTAEVLAATTRDIGVTVTDDNIAVGGTSGGQVVATATLENVNDSPTLETLTSLSIDFGESIDFALAGADVDGDGLTYTATVAGLAASETQPTINSNGQFTWVPSEAGSFDVTVQAADSTGAIAEQTFTVTVGDFVPFAGVGALSNIDPLQKNDIYTAAPPQNINTLNTYDAVIDTNRGEIRINLLVDESPTFVNNFVNLARDGFYDGLVFHRVIDGFVAQGGDPLGTSTSSVPGQGPGQGGPGYEIPDEVGNTLPFDSRGQLAFANSGNNTTGSQFFITFSATNLNANQFSVFGNVTAGDSVLDAITRTQVGNNTPIPGAVPDVINSITIEETIASIS